MDFTKHAMSDRASETAALSAVGTAAVPYLSSTLDSLKWTASNATAYLNPSPMDLLLALPRIAHRAGTFTFFTLPEHIDSLLSNRYGRSMIPEATGDTIRNLATTAGASMVQVHDASGAMAGATAATTNAGTFSGVDNAMGFNSVRGFGGIVSYLTSKWALACFTMAIILNRTQVYASARRHIRLAWTARLVLRLVPILLFLYQASRLVQATRCQTSPTYPTLRYAKPNLRYQHDFAGAGGLLHGLTSRLLFWQSDEETCRAVGMIPSSADVTKTGDIPMLRGSLSFMWPLFQALCFGQFVETMSCAVQGRMVMAETGMTLLEHSLAFAEAEAMVSNQLGWGPFGFPRPEAEGFRDAFEGHPLPPGTLVTKTLVLNRLNTPPELLLIGLISTMSHLTSHVLAVFGLQGRFRLVSTGFWGLCFMAVFLGSMLTFHPGPSGDVDLLRFPTVCIVGYIPHLLIMMGILTCAGIYLLALLLTATAPPGPHRPRSLKERFVMAQQNLQANIQLSRIRISMHEDFYTCLLKVGFTALTAASEAVFLNEGRPVRVRHWTWLEEERMREIEAARHVRRAGATRGSEGGGTDGTLLVADGVGFAEMGDEGMNGRVWASGYGRERTTEKLAAGSSHRTRGQGDGVGAAERSSRWVMAWDLFRGIFWLVTGASALVVVKLLESVGVMNKPQWLRKLARREKAGSEPPAPADASERTSLEFWLLSDDGVLRLPNTTEVDVELEMRKRAIGSGGNAEADEEELDQNLYGWWKQGGWFGELDGSGTFVPPEQDDDTTSLVSQTTVTTDDGWESDEPGADGRTTPTPEDPFPRERAASPLAADESTVDVAHLARLLDPRNAHDRHEAQLLSHHLTSPQILTRSRFRRSVEQQRAQVLTSTRYRPSGRAAGAMPLPPAKPTAAEEAEMLEHLLLSRRESQPLSAPTSGPDETWSSGADGLGAGGPQCVVCQSNPRTILVWPCRCLSLCEDCRVSLAMNNFGACVCCRRDVIGFSRIFVP
ncbi:MAG: hypothetical protein M1838_000512 [Thelocarpon superellum]|nr:MAG: hypothetical protein M1838_000512 [Thelocarpon superellum]